MGWLRGWIGLVSLLVPRRRRRDWREEWRGELESRRRHLEAGKISRRRVRRDLTAHALGAVSDAIYLRAEGWSMERMVRDFGGAVRSLTRKPFFTALAGLTLAVGIGANTAIYSVVDGVLLNPLPYPDSERLVSVNHTAPGLGVPIVPHSEGSYLHYREHFSTLRAFAVYTNDNVNLMLAEEPRRVAAASVTEDFLDVLGVQPVLGRDFTPGEDRVGAEPVAILGYGLWQQTFGGDRDVVGRVVEMDGVNRRIVGVLPEGFQYPAQAEVWVPMEIDAAEPSLGSMSFIGIGRLADGATVESADADMQAGLLGFSDAHPEELPREVLEQAGMSADIQPLKDLFVQDVAQALWILLGTVGFVLLIACANVANLFLVRAEARQREQAVRTALGAGWGDMVRHYLTESVTLGVGAGLLGLGLASVGVQGLLKLAPVAVPRSGEIGIDGSVLAFTLVISVGSGLLFGLFPLFGYGRPDLSSALKEGGRASTSGRERHRARSALVVTQVALALMLLVGSGLMMRSFVSLRQIDPGFDVENRLTFRVQLPVAEYPDAESVRLFHRSLVERLAATPGVTDAAVATAVPLEDHKSAGPMEAEDDPVTDGLAPMVDRRAVSPGFFQTMGIPLVAGRELTWDDAAAGVRGAVISETTARVLWPGEDAVGRRIRNQGDEEGWEVVGVAADVRFEELESEPAPLIYLPLTSGPAEAPQPTRAVAAVLRVGSDPLGYVSAAREALRAVAPRLPLVAPRTVESVARDAMATTSFTVLLLGIAAGIALLLGTVGIYGVISYVVSRRTQEIGVRLALGAPRVSVVRSVVGQGMALTGMGIAVGLVGAWGVSRLVASLLYGVSATDPLTYAGTVGLLAAVALLAAFLPARRASRVDPVEALRQE